MQPIFKVGDRVFWNRKGWGKIINIDNPKYPNYPITAEFNDSYYSFTIDGKLHSDDLVPSLSFTEYFMIRFSQTRPKPDLKPGDLIWVRNDGDEWLYKRFYAWTDKGVEVKHQRDNNQVWEYNNYSVECPVTSPPSPPSPREIYQA